MATEHWIWASIPDEPDTQPTPCCGQTFIISQTWFRHLPNRCLKTQPTVEAVGPWDKTFPLFKDPLKRGFLHKTFPN